ncbi:ceramide-1-phosphate transfer protein isoform X2 [Gouania willdenowi]|uniref:ceramide-1-phosphate transfer protein isoform X2 n=1 Tax=Gouania willdenowi TaxID=441366 RepID=UPI001056010F|nr:ceramide-1-phosphate transfer protein-like isoform X2 [Gouania willdenowi]
MFFLRRTPWLRYLLLLAAILALFLFFSSFWLPQRECGSAGQPCFIQRAPEPPLFPGEPVIKECPGQSFQAGRLLLHLRSSMLEEDDVLLENYLLGWDQLISFMESLGTMVGFFSQKVKDKVQLIRDLSLKHREGEQGQGGPYRSVRTMVGAELQRGVVSFSERSDSGCRTLLRLHRSLLWLRLLLHGLSEDQEPFKTPGELSRDAYQVALAPHHSWFLRNAAELVFLALPDRHHFLRVVCVRDQREATPILRVIIHTLTLVHDRTQRILDQHGMLELP